MWILDRHVHKNNSTNFKSLFVYLLATSICCKFQHKQYQFTNLLQSTFDRVVASVAVGGRHPLALGSTVHAALFLPPRWGHQHPGLQPILFIGFTFFIAVFTIIILNIFCCALPFLLAHPLAAVNWSNRPTRCAIVRLHRHCRGIRATRSPQPR